MLTKRPPSVDSGLGETGPAEAVEEEAAPEELSYVARFHEDENKLNITPAEQFPEAVDHIDRVVEMTKSLVEQNLAYEVQGNVFFSAFGFSEYGTLSGRSEEQVGLEAVPVEGEPIKLAPRDFPLWDATQIKGEDPWQGPWGPGVPSRHSACSAMTLESLGEQFDIHTGEADDVYPHHENEVADTESYTGKRAANMWVNCQPLLVDGVGMRRSSDNVLTLADIEARGIEPLAFRYLCLTTRHSSSLNFTFRQLRAAQRGLLQLRNRMLL